MSSTQRLLIVVLVLAALAVLVANLQIGFHGAVLASLLVCGVLWITKPIWAPPGFGATKVRLASIAGIFALAASHGVWATLINSTIAELIMSPALVAKYPWLKDVTISSEPSYAVLAFVLAGVFIIHYFLPDRTISGQHPTPVEKEFPEKDYGKKLDSFCIHLTQKLTYLDQETNWSPEYYTPLEAAESKLAHEVPD